jgi:hypothetical protein
VLREHGWNIHRIWSTDWFQRPEQELRKVLAAYEAAKASAGASTPRVRVAQEMATEKNPASNFIPLEAVVVENDDVRAAPYQEASFAVPTVELLDLSSAELAQIAVKVVEVEGPIHEQELIVRVRSLFGLQRAGNLIQDAVKASLKLALRGKAVVRLGQVYDINDRLVRVRDRSAVNSPSLRKPEFLPPSEIRAATLLLIERHLGAKRAELQTHVARLVGFKKTSQQLAQLIDAEIDTMLREGLLNERDGCLFGLRQSSDGSRWQH